MQEFINNVSHNQIVEFLFVMLLLDIFLGSLRAIKERKWNSTVGINGMLRKAGMIGSIVLLALADTIMQFNLIGFVDKEVLNIIKIQKVGLCEFFGIMFILYEATSVLKNMALIDLPVFHKFNKKIQDMLTSMTSELDDKK
jgi:toxin secretion/phage lysis holin